MALFTLVLFLWVFSRSALVTTSQRISPCPQYFTYETNSTAPDRWYGVVTLLSDADLTGVWLRIVLDRPAIQLGNWFGQVSSDDNREFLIKKPKFQLVAEVPLKVRFFVRYSEDETPPQLIEIRLNARTICAQSVTTTESYGTELYTSKIVEPTPQPTLEHISLSHGNTSTFSTDANDNDDFFPGDTKVTLLPITQIAATTPSTDTSCGIITDSSTGSTKEYPWHTSISLVKENGVISQICDGALLTRSHIITSARCINDTEPEDFIIYLGKYNLKRWTGDGMQTKNVESILIHPQFNNDLAIIKLIEPVTITDYVRPICLWQKRTTLPQQNGNIIGWGYDADGRFTNNLMKNPIIVGNCSNSTRQFCGHYRRDVRNCNAQLGGGIVFYEGNLWRLRGIISDIGRYDRLKCNKQQIITFTDVVQYLDWIQANLESYI